VLNVAIPAMVSVQKVLFQSDHLVSHAVLVQPHWVVAKQSVLTAVSVKANLYLDKNRVIPANQESTLRNQDNPSVSFVHRASTWPRVARERVVIVFKVLTLIKVAKRNVLLVLWANLPKTTMRGDRVNAKSVPLDGLVFQRVFVTRVQKVHTKTKLVRSLVKVAPSIVVATFYKSHCLPRRLPTLVIVSTVMA